MNLRKTKVVEGITPRTIPDEILCSQVPVVLKGLVKQWPLVKHGLESANKVSKYLKGHYNGKLAGAYYGAPEIKGRYFYNDDWKDINFSVKKTQLDEMLDSLIEHMDQAQPPSLYIASNNIETHFPTLRQDNDLCLNHDEFDGVTPLVSIWIGNKTLVSCHYDALSNIACCAVGHRNFTMFPPSQIENLYPGPLSPTPGGQAVSMVDFKNPDFIKFPKFKTALEHGQIAELEPGDALFIPTMWWHQVEGLDTFNVLVNYWWTRAPDYMGKSMTVLLHALMSLRDQPKSEKEAWRHIFDYYIFSDPETANSHIPQDARGILESANDMRARQLKAMILAKLNR